MRTKAIKRFGTTRKRKRQDKSGTGGKIKWKVWFKSGWFTSTKIWTRLQREKMKGNLGKDRHAYNYSRRPRSWICYCKDRKVVYFIWTALSFVLETRCNLYLLFTRKLRCSPPEVFLCKNVLKKCSKFTGEYPCRGAISLKLHTTLLKSGFDMCFSC